MKKFFTKSAEINFLMLWISYLVYPLSLILVKLKIKPNLITFVSLLSAIYGSFQFILGNFADFTIFWVSSIFLDFCDGQVARISKSENKTAFNFDSLSDLMKISLITLSSAIYYNIKLYWIISCCFIFLFLFHEVLFTHFGNLKKKASIFENELIKNKVYVKIFKQLTHFFFRIDGHSLLFFLFLALNINFALIILVYMQFVLLLNIFRVSYLLLKHNV
jgi:phosphatidylglycerophosphate synthase